MPHDRPHDGQLRQVPTLLLLASILGFTAVRALVAVQAGLTEDEAYYRLWALGPALSYLDHPPFVAWMIAAGRAMAGDNPLGIRLGTLVGGIVGPLALWRTARLMFGNQVARRAVWFSLAMPLLAAGGVIITPDTPSVLFWGFAAWALAELHVTRNANWWLLVGLFAGLGLLSKYTNLFVGVAIALWLALLPANWRWFRSWQLWAGSLLAALFTLPVVVWNAHHQWASFAKQFGRAAASDGLSARYLAEFLGAYLALASPLIAVLAVVGLWKVVSRAAQERDQACAMVAAGALPLLAYLVQHALYSRVQPNWAAPLYPALAVCAAIAVEAGGFRPRLQLLFARLANAGIAIGVLMSALLYVHALRPLVARTGVKDPVSQMRGWPVFAARVDQLRLANGACWIATSSYGTRGQLAYALRLRVPVVQLDEPLRYVHLPRLPADTFRCPALYVELQRRASSSWLKRQFRTVTRLPSFRRRHGDASIAGYAIYRLADPVGSLPPQ